MAFTLTPNLGLRLDSNLTANAKYNLQTLDTIGGIVTVDSTGTTRMRGRLGLAFTANDASVGGSGTGGTVTFGTQAQPLTSFTVWGPVSFPTSLVLGMSGDTTTLVSGATAPWTLTLPTGPGTAGQVLQTDGTGTTSWHTPNVGTVTSVGLSAPAEWVVTGSPVTSAGTLTLTKATQAAGTVWAGPTSGGPGTPSFRALVASDIPGGIAPTVANTNSINLTIGGGNVLTADLRLADSTLAVGPSGVSVGLIANANVAAGAAVAYSKLALTGSIVNSDVAAGAAILLTKTDLHSLAAKASPLPTDEVLIYDVAGGTNKKATLASLAGATAAATTWVTGDGATKTFTHNLGTEDVALSVYDLASGASIELDSVVRISTAAVTLTASSAPPATSWRILAFSAGSAVFGGTGTVTSVGLSAPGSIFSVTGSPVTSSGTLALGLATQTANSVFAGPMSGGAATPGFRALVAADIPPLPYAPSFTAGSISTSTTGVTVGNGAASTVGPNVTLNIQTATSSQPGLLSAADWTTFNGKAASFTPGNIVTSTVGVSIGGGTGATVGPNTTINVATATSGSTGLLTAADWIAFNAKQPAGSYLTALTGDVAASGPGSAVATIQPGVITNAKVASGAAIDYAKLNLTGFVTNSDIAGAAGIVYSKLSLTGSLLNTDIAAGANISYSKLNLASSIVNSDVAAGAAVAYSKLALTNSIVNADIATSAAITYSKLSLTGSIVNADVASGAAIAYSKLSLTGSVVNADVASGAAIAYSKLASLPSANILVGSAGNVATAVTMSGGATISNAGVVTLTNASVTGQALTGFAETTGAVAATDTILQAIDKLSGNEALPFFGDGSDGTVTLSAGVTTLTQDMYYQNLTINGTGSINTAGYRIFVAGTLDLSAAPAGAITFPGLAGGSSATTGAGAAPALISAQTVGIGTRGPAGKAGGTAAGSNGTTGVNVTQGNGGGSPATGSSGNGGAGSGGAGGTGGTAGSITQTLPIRRFAYELNLGTAQLQGGSSGPSGGSGGGDGGSGGGSGAGGSGGNVIYIAANTLNRGASTAASAISAVGGTGGSGGTPTTGNRGGGGGGSAGGGGWIYFVYRRLTGSTATNLFDVSGGTGGNGGNGTGTGIGGAGGGGGSGGSITLFNMGTGTGTNIIGAAGSAGTAGSGTTGGTGGAGASTKVSL